MSPARRAKSRTRPKGGASRGPRVGWFVALAVLLALGALWALVRTDPSDTGEPHPGEIGEESREALREILRDADAEGSAR